MPITSTTLKKFNCIEYYIETGTHVGESLDIAYAEGFKNITTIDIAPCNIARDRYKEKKNVTFVLGDSSVVLKEIIKNIDSQIVFYLDAHLSNNSSIYESLPLFNELQAINNHKIKNHVITIDDMRLFSDKTKQELTQAILNINSNYKVTFEADRLTSTDILVAQVM